MNTKSLSLFLGLSILTGCVFEPGTVKVNVNRKSSSTSSSSKSISSVSVINNQIKITGTGLEGVTSLKIKNNNLNETFSIESATATQIIANASHALSIGVGQIFDLILNSAEGASTFPISFSLDNGSVTAAMLSSMSASPGQVLIYNGATWVPSSISSSQLYIGTWNANTNTPDLNLTTPQAGDYYVVTTGGTQGAVTYAIGDWIISNGTTWSKLSHSSSVVGSFNGRTGLVVPASGDYTWAQINKTSSKLEEIADIDITGRVDQKILKWDATNSKWIMGNDNTGAGAPGPGSITTTEILDGTIANNDLAGSIAQSKITNLTTDLASKLGLTSLSATAPMGYDNTTGVFSITNATIALDGAMSAADKIKLDGLEALSAGNGLLERFSGTIRSNTCADGEVLKWVTLTGWTCSTDSSTDASKQSTLTDSAGLAAALSDEIGTGLAVFNSAPTIIDPVIANIAPTADFTLTQNGIAPFTSVNTGAVANTLYLKDGKVGMGTTSPGSSLDVKGILRLSGATSGYVGFEPAAAAGATTYKLPVTQGTAGQVLSTDGVATNATLSWVTPATSSISLVGDIGGSVGANIIGNDKVTSTHLLDGTILNADINNAANIDITKLGTGAVSTTEFNYLTGVTSSIQTQLSAKEPTIPTGATTDYIRGDKTLSVFATDVINSVLSTYTISASAKPAIANTDTVVGAFNKIQKYINDIDGDYVSKSASTNNTVSGVVTFNTIGSLNIGYTPTNATDAVSKAYVDSFGAWTRGAGDDIYRLNGNVGIGTTAPGFNFDIQSTTASFGLTRSVNSAASPDIYLQKDRGTIGAPTIIASGDSLGHVNFRGYDGANYIRGARISGFATATPAASSGFITSDLVFYTNDNTADATEKMRIKSNGNVGIGTTSPSTALDVFSETISGPALGRQISGITVFTNGMKASTVYKKLFLLPVTSVSNFAHLVISGAVGGWVSGQGKASVNISMSTRDAENFIGTYSGNLGNCDIRVYKLADNSYEVWGVYTSAGSYTTPWSLSANGTLEINTVGNGSNAVYVGKSNAETTTAPTGTQLWSLSTNAQQVLTNSGNVGIGMTSPTSVLDIQASYNDVSLNANAQATASFRTPGHVQMAINTQLASPYTTSLQAKHTTADGQSYPLALNPLGGNVGIGTTSPQSVLDLGGSSSGRGISWHTNSTTSYGNIWQSLNGGRTTIANGLKGSTTVNNGFESSTSAIWGRTAIEQDYGLIKFYTDAATTTAYGTAMTPTERMRIDTSGNVGIGTTAPGYKLDVQGGDINASGSVRAAGVALTSDIRFKNNVMKLDHALEKIISLNGVSYYWKTDEFPERNFNERKQIGVIAQQVEKKFPELVDTDVHGFKSVNYPALVAPLIEAVKTLYGRILGHEKENEYQNRQIASLDKNKADKVLVEMKLKKIEAENLNLKKENEEVKMRLEKIEKILSKTMQNK